MVRKRRGMDFIRCHIHTVTFEDSCNNLKDSLQIQMERPSIRELIHHMKNKKASKTLDIHRDNISQDSTILSCPKNLTYLDQGAKCDHIHPDRVRFPTSFDLGSNACPVESKTDRTPQKIKNRAYFSLYGSRFEKTESIRQKNINELGIQKKDLCLRNTARRFQFITETEQTNVTMRVRQSSKQKKSPYKKSPKKKSPIKVTRIKHRNQRNYKTLDCKRQNRTKLNLTVNSVRIQQRKMSDICAWEVLSPY